jgi:CheY-like chemotaxis protein
MASIAKRTPEVALEVAADLHGIAEEAAMLDQSELFQAAREGEDSARSLADGSADAFIPCLRSLRRLGYLVQEASEAQQDQAGTPGSEAKRGSRRLLIVDDSQVAAAALADVFEMHGFSVRVASTFDEVRVLLGSFAPTLLVSDVHMPGLDVAQVCRSFRASAADRRVAVVLVSGRAEGELRERLAEIKPEAFVSKLAGAIAVVTRVNSIYREFVA